MLRVLVFRDLIEERKKAWLGLRDTFIKFSISIFQKLSEERLSDFFVEKNLSNIVTL